MAVLSLVVARRRARKRRLQLLAGAAWLLFLRKKSQQRRRTVWVRDWLLRRDDLGAYGTLLSELREEDKGSFLNFLRVSPGMFDDLVNRVSPLIERQDTYYRKSIAPGMRLAITLRYLATGIYENIIVYVKNFILKLTEPQF
jgi:hypothetical protein